MKRHTQEEIREHLSNIKKSGLTIDAYCKKADIATSTFWYWRKKYRSDLPAKTAIPFLRLPTAPLSSTSLFEILFANNIRLKVPFDIDPDSLKSLIALLR